MSTIEFRVITSKPELEQAFPVMKELRPHLTLERYLNLINEAAKRDQYEVVGAYDGDKCVGAMGHRVLFDFVHGKHLYIDDLVVTEGHRSQKIGAQLLKFAEKYAKEIDCDGLRLCTGVENDKGKSFYEREGWTARALAYKKSLRTKI